MYSYLLRYYTSDMFIYCPRESKILLFGENQQAPLPLRLTRYSQPKSSQDSTLSHFLAFWISCLLLISDRLFPLIPALYSLPEAFPLKSHTFFLAIHSPTPFNNPLYFKTIFACKVGSFIFSEHIRCCFGGLTGGDT